MEATTPEQVERYIRSRIPRSEDVRILEAEGELHLMRGDDHFARLIPTEKKGFWRMEYYHNLEEWKHYDVVCSLEECLSFLMEEHHYLFWE